ncbi:hypothetical protein PG987_000252 [Apiospora arundinis]
MNRVMKGHRDGVGESLGIPTDPILASFEAHRCFTNKLAQILDKEPGGRTVTSLTILQKDGRPIYVMASNFRNQEELDEARNFLRKLLSFVHDNPFELNPKPLFRKALGQIILFSFPRIQAYLVNLRRYLGNCIDDCRNQGETEPVKELVHELETLQKKASFPMKHDTDNERDQFLSSCDALLAAIPNNKGTRVDESILEHCDDTSKSNLEAWQELRHSLGRLLSYRQAAEVILATNKRWPQLFRRFYVKTISRSHRAPNPVVNRDLSAEAIVRSMLWDYEDPDPYLQQVSILNEVGLDDELKGQLNKKTFRPIVHAEVQVHAVLIQQDIFHSSDFWNGHKYIGSSKPTCRLCAYYFFERGDGIQVRPTHQNLYPNWRLPDVYPSQGPDEARTHRQLLERITERVRKDAKRTLDERLPSRRKHDSNDRSSIPSLLKQPDWQDMESTVSDMTSETSRLHVDSFSASGSAAPSSIHHGSLGRPMEEVEDGFESDDEEGRLPMGAWVRA